MKARIFLIVVICYYSMVLLYSQNNKANFETWDGNGDGKISRDEYLVNARMVERWDDDKDNKLSQEEFQNSLFKLLDSDGDNKLTMNEWNKADTLVRTHKNNDVRLDQWDANQDGVIDKYEFDRNIPNVFNAWDKNNDNYLSKNEFYEGAFKWWDLDNSGDISRSEFDKIKNLTKDNRSLWDRIF